MERTSYELPACRQEGEGLGFELGGLCPRNLRGGDACCGRRLYCACGTVISAPSGAGYIAPLVRGSYKAQRRMAPRNSRVPSGTADSSPVVKSRSDGTPGKREKIIRARAASRMRCRGGRQSMAAGVSPEPIRGFFCILYSPVDRKRPLSSSAATHSLRSGFNLSFIPIPGVPPLRGSTTALLAVALWAHKLGGRSPRNLRTRACASDRYYPG